jgi:hypothetical protein
MDTAHSAWLSLAQIAVGPISALLGILVGYWINIRQGLTKLQLDMKRDALIAAISLFAESQKLLMQAAAARWDDIASEGAKEAKLKSLTPQLDDIYHRSFQTGALLKLTASAKCVASFSSLLNDLMEACRGVFHGDKEQCMQAAFNFDDRLEEFVGRARSELYSSRVTD